MTDPTFTEGQRVYHRGLLQSATYLRPDLHHAEKSVVDFNEGCDRQGRVDIRRVTTAQLVPADEVEENI